MFRDDGHRKCEILERENEGNWLRGEVFCQLSWIVWLHFHQFCAKRLSTRTSNWTTGVINTRSRRWCSVKFYSIMILDPFPSHGKRLESEVSSLINIVETVCSCHFQSNTILDPMRRAGASDLGISFKYVKSATLKVVFLDWIVSIVTNVIPTLQVMQKLKVVWSFSFLQYWIILPVRRKKDYNKSKYSHFENSNFHLPSLCVTFLFEVSAARCVFLLGYTWFMQPTERFVATTSP